MRKSLIITAALMVSSLFAGSAFAQDRGTERPTVRSMTRADRADGARAYSERLRERNEHQGGRAVTTRGSSAAESKVTLHREKGDMVDGSARRQGALKERQHQSITRKTVAEKRSDISEKNRKRGDVQSRNGNKRTFTIANDRSNRGGRSGSIVDVMKRKEMLKFLSGLGVKINCSQTGTCVEETTM